MKYFEDIEENAPHYSTERYTLSKQEIIEFSGHWDPMPFHLDEAVAEQSYVGKLFTSGVHTVAIASRLCHSMSEEKVAAVAGLGWDEVRFHQPACIGDEFWVKSFVCTKRESRSKPDRGIMTTRIELYNQRDELVTSFTMSSLVLKRPRD